MASGVLIIAEQRDGKFRKVVYELLNIGKQIADKIGGPLSAVVVGKGVGEIAKTLGKFGASKVFVVDSDALNLYNTEGYAAAVAAAVKAADPAVVLAGTTAMGKDLVPRVAAKLGVGMSSDTTKIEVEGGKLLVTRPVYSGKCLARVELTGTPQIVAVRPNTYPAAAESSATAQIAAVSADLAAKAKVTQVNKTGEGKIELTEAERIVSGGRGIKDKANFKILEDLAAVIHAAVGASRAAVDSGYATLDMQVGQTGKVVNPTLYMAFGISGAIQHLAGMRTSKIIVAVNKDSEAPIFQKADYGIVDDLFKVVPVLTEELKKLLAE